MVRDVKIRNKQEMLLCFIEIRGFHTCTVWFLQETCSSSNQRSPVKQKWNFPLRESLLVLFFSSERHLYVTCVLFIVGNNLLSMSNFNSFPYEIFLIKISNSKQTNLKLLF